MLHTGERAPQRAQSRSASHPLAGTLAAKPSGKKRRTHMTIFVFTLKAPRPTFALDMSEQEREVMGRHAAYWRPFIDSGQMVVFGPVLDTTGSWGLGVIEAKNEDELRAFAAGDPVVTTGTGTIEIGKMLSGFLRPADPAAIA